MLNGYHLTIGSEYIKSENALCRIVQIEPIAFFHHDCWVERCAHKLIYILNGVGHVHVLIEAQ